MGIMRRASGNVDVRRRIHELYAQMSELAEQIRQNENLLQDPAELFRLQQQLQILKDTISEVTAVGKMITDVIGDGKKSFYK